MRIKRLFAVGILASILLCACGGNNNSTDGANSENVQSDVVYDGDGLNVKIVPALDEVQHSAKVWEDITAETAINDNNLIVEGTINSIDEISVISTGQGLVYKTLVELTPTKTLKDTNGIVEYNQPITIVVQSSSREYEAMAPDLIEGKKCVFLAKSADSIEDDSIDYTKFCDAVVTSPVNYIIPVISKNVYQIKSFFCVEIEEVGGTASLANIVNTHSSYSDISRQLYNGEKITEFTAIVSISDMDDLRVKDSELLWSLVNKKYADEDGFINDVMELHLTTAELFQEIVNKYNQ